MSSATSHRRTAATSPAPDDEQPSGDAYDDAIDAEDSAEIEEETGLDLTDASALDADNVPADEEHDRVGHAPD